jgi:hypothetical protein
VCVCIAEQERARSDRARQLARKEVIQEEDKERDLNFKEAQEEEKQQSQLQHHVKVKVSLRVLFFQKNQRKIKERQKSKSQRSYKGKSILFLKSQLQRDTSKHSVTTRSSRIRNKFFLFFL